VASSSPAAVAAPADPGAPIPIRTIVPRRSLPGTRAITGGVLVAIAAIGVYVATSGAAGDHRQPVVVASHDIAPGAQLSASDFQIVRMRVSPADATHVARSSTRFAGATTLGPIKAGELIQTGDIEFNSTNATQPEISIALPIARALGGDLHPGDTVDVVVTDKTAGSTTRTAASDAKVVRIGQTNSGLTNDGTITVTFAVTSREDATALAEANDNGQITLVRTTGVPSESTGVPPGSTGVPPATTPAS
jgi:Flp pilus assembly protein CpaB